MYLLATILCLVLGSAIGADVKEGDYDVTAMCTTVPVGTKLGSIVSCDYYYVCKSKGPEKESCNAGYAYDHRKQACGAPNTVNCFYGVQDPCSGRTSDSWVPVPGTCKEWTYCKGDQKGGSGTCQDDTIFDATAQRCIYGNCENTGPLSGPSLKSPCEVAPANMYFGSTEHCQQWQLCTADGAYTTGYCATSAFIVAQGKCGYNNKGECNRVTGSGTPTSCDNNK